MARIASIKRNPINAEPVFRDRDVVDDGIVITSRNRERVEEFCAAIVRRSSQPPLRA